MEGIKKEHKIVSFVAYFVNAMSLRDVDDNGYFFKSSNCHGFLGKAVELFRVAFSTVWNSAVILSKTSSLNYPRKIKYFI